MPAARKESLEERVSDELKKDGAAVKRGAERAIYAVTHILPGFAPGSRIDGKLSPETIDTLLEHGDASEHKPDEPQEPEAAGFGVAQGPAVAEK